LAGKFSIEFASGAIFFAYFLFHHSSGDASDVVVGMLWIALFGCTIWLAESSATSLGKSEEITPSIIEIQPMPVAVDIRARKPHAMSTESPVESTASSDSTVVVLQTPGTTTISLPELSEDEDDLFARIQQNAVV